MKLNPNNLKISTLAVLWISLIASGALVAVITIRYSYDILTLTYSGIGVFILLCACAALWWLTRRQTQPGQASLIEHAIQIGMVLGLLWIIEISINNFIAPPLPARDTIDNLFWAVITLATIALATRQTIQTGSFSDAVTIGAWSGFTSGALSCGMALVVIIFAMPFITRDPLNVAEWAARGTDISAPNMAAYFAYETLAGAFLHLVLLGIIFGIILGLLGGAIGKSFGWVLKMAKPH